MAFEEELPRVVSAQAARRLGSEQPMGSHTRGAFALALITIILSSVSIQAAEINWGTYHKDEPRLGINEAVTPQDLSGIGLIWTFPRLDVSPIREEETIVDMIPGNDDSTFSPTASWNGSIDFPLVPWAGDFYGDQAGLLSGFYFKEARPTDPSNPVTNSTPTARWKFPNMKLTPDQKPRGFIVQVWFPSTSAAGDSSPYINTTVAKYTVYHQGQATTCVVDQTDGGRWVNLRDEPFLLGPKMNDPMPEDRVELTNQIAMDKTTYDNDPNKSKLIVCADAVRFIPSTGIEMYSSPAAGKANVDSTGVEIPAVWIGAIESSVASFAEGVKDFGAIYCVRSYTGDAYAGGTTPIDWSDPDVVGVGSPAWRYPIGGAYDYLVDPATHKIIEDVNGDPTRRSPNLRKSVEGPIGRIGSVGGVFSSPTLIPMSGIEGGLAVVVGGMDGQVYCLNATTGRLIWKGPGVTLPEPATLDPLSGWTATAGRQDAFGGSFASRKVVPTAVANLGQNSGLHINYNIAGATNSDPAQDAAAAAGTGHLYAIYAWMPGPAGDSRTKDAAYRITFYDAATEKTKTEIIRVDQSGDIIPAPVVPPPGGGSPPPGDTGVSEDPNVGRWARVGGSYWNPSLVELMPDSVVAKDPKYADRVVVADAIMVVPDDIGAFSYSTAAWSGTANGYIYMGNTNGRVYAFSLGNYVDTPEKSIHLAWTFPQVQTQNPVVDIAVGAAASPVGEIVASPTYYQAGSLVVVPSTDGKVYSLDAERGTLRWATSVGVPYDSSKDSDTSTSNEEEFFSSSAAIKDGIAYVPSTGGRMHAINLSDGTRNWMFPNRSGGTGDSEAPFSAFRFSTPSKDDTITQKRVLCASSGGIVHGIDTSTSPPTEDAGYAQPNFFAPIQSSVALDPANLFVGSLGVGDGDDGGIWWVDRFTGYPVDPTPDGDLSDAWAGWGDLGMVFSSPAVANQYVYVGTGKGRLCAFSSIAFGGNWVGGEQGSEPPGRRSRPPDPLSAKSPQADIYSSAVYEETLKAVKYYAESDGTSSVPRLDSAADRTIGTLLSSVPGIDTNRLFVPTPTWEAKEAANEVFDGHKKAHGSSGAVGREIYLEWGEEICLIAWNINQLTGLQPVGTGSTSAYVGDAPKKNSVTFRFTNASAGAGSGGTIQSKNADMVIQYKTKDEKGVEVERCLAMARIPINASSQNPPSPGSGWNVSVSIKLNANTTTTRASSSTAIIPLLTGSGPGSWTVKGLGATTPTWEAQPIGINNPLAIWTGSNAGESIAWPRKVDDLYLTDYGSNDQAKAQAHFNGNGAWVTDETGRSTGSDEIIPKLYLGEAKPINPVYATHGANSPIRMLGVMDRSATGLTITVPGSDPPVRGNAIRSFRLQPGDMHWQGGTDAVAKSGGILLPWDYPPEFNFGTYGSRLQRDYPDISRRMEFFQKAPENSDPSVEKTELSPALAKPNSKVVDYSDSATGCWLQADGVDTWVQVPQFQPANMSGPGYSTTVIAYLDTNSNGRFDGGSTISGRPTSYIETYRKFSVALDVPPDYHMVVERPLTIDITGADRALAPHGLGIGVDPANLKNWYKDFTVRNLGNVNLPYLKIGKKIAGYGSLNMFAENVNPFFPLSGTNIVSSLGDWDPQFGDTIQGEPFITTGYGYTLSKARVGEVNPMELTIPDARKCLEMGLGEGIMPSVSVRVPLTQPAGSYHQQVPVFADFNNDDVLDLSSEPYSDPTFRLNVVVAEDRMTGGPTPGSAPQIDAATPVGETPIISGNTQPTAWRDPTSGDVHVFWSSNRFATGPPTASDPWYLAHASLRYDLGGDNLLDRYDWRLLGDDPSMFWWETPALGDPGFKLPGFSWPTPVPTGLVAQSVKHSAPFAAVNPDSDKVWLFWQGQADAKDNGTGKINRNSLIFYTPATGAEVTGNEASVISFARDLSMPKLNPRAVCYNSGSGASAIENMWVTWHGGEAGRWSLFGSLNSSPASSHDANAWSQDIRFITPTCLVSMADPSPVHRKIGDSTKFTDWDKFLDLTYTGTTKYDQSADIVLTRYKWSGDAKNPKVDPVLMPRIYNEELLRDSKKNVYTTEHLALIRPASAGMVDVWDWDSGRKDRTVHNDAPFIHVVLAEETGVGDITLPIGTEISGTDGSVVEPDGTVIQAAAAPAIAPTIDRATNTYAYELPGIAKTFLGQMIVDFSAGIVRFSNAIPPKTKVYADYTPQSIRLTRGQEHDSAPFMFLEKTEMAYNATEPCPNPGLVEPTGYTGPKPTDRYWLFWRKATSGVGSSTIYYKTYRIAVTLPDRIVGGKSVPAPVGISDKGRPTNSVTVTNSLGPCEVSWDGKKIFFTAVDERYPGMPGYAGPVSIEYVPKGETRPITVSFDTLTFEEELAETALPTRQNVNEGQITAFADPGVTPSKIWVFWSSTRAGETDLYYQTISPNFTALY